MIAIISVIVIISVFLVWWKFFRIVDPIGEWGECTGECGGEGIQIKNLECPEGYNCGDFSKTESRPCSVGLCKGGIPDGEWGECKNEKDCGEGEQTRILSCPEGYDCGDFEPVQTRKCDLGTCTEQHHFKSPVIVPSGEYIDIPNSVVKPDSKSWTLSFKYKIVKTPSSSWTTVINRFLPYPSGVKKSCGGGMRAPVVAVQGGKWHFRVSGSKEVCGTMGSIPLPKDSDWHNMIIVQNNKNTSIYHDGLIKINKTRSYLPINFSDSDIPVGSVNGSFQIKDLILSSRVFNTEDITLMQESV